MENIINQIKDRRPELGGLLESEVEIDIINNDTFSWPNIVGETIEIHAKTLISPVAMAIEIAYAVQALRLIRHCPEQRLACCILARQFAFQYLSTLNETERESYKVFLSEYSVNESALLEAYEILRDASPQDKARCLGTYLLKQDFPSDSEHQLNEAVHLATLAWPVACPTHLLLTQGGDERLHLSSETGTNKYCIAPVPQRDVLIRSSCTSSPPTVSGFLTAELLRQKLLIAALKKELSTTFSMSLKNIRNRLAAAFELDQNESTVICTPSGTDAEILMTYLALGMSQKIRSNQTEQQTLEKSWPDVCNILVAAGEVGSGTVAACGCRYFSSCVPDGSQVSTGNYLEGVKDVEVIALPARNPNGAIKDVKSLERQIEQLVEDSIENKGQIVVLHKVNCSKTGIKVPSFSFLYRLKQKYRDSIIVVVDAAQMRCEISALSEYLNAGFCLLSTGSKFFSGAPFSGLLLLPNQAKSSLSSQESVPGLGNYFAKDEVDEQLTPFRDNLPTRQNYGLLLRWAMALENIEQYLRIPLEQRTYIISHWLKKAKKLVEETAYVNLFTDQVIEIDRQSDRLGGCNTIISLTVHPEAKKALDTESLKAVYQWMSQDISAWLPSHATPEERLVAKQKCLLGQPVKITSGPSGFGVLRIALGAPMVWRMAAENSLSDVETRDPTQENTPLNSLAKEDLEDGHPLVERRKNPPSPIVQKRYLSFEPHIRRELEDDQRILDKLSLIGKYYHFFPGRPPLTRVGF